MGDIKGDTRSLDSGSFEDMGPRPLKPRDLNRNPHLRYRAYLSPKNV